MNKHWDVEQVTFVKNLAQCLRQIQSLINVCSPPPFLLNPKIFLFHVQMCKKYHTEQCNETKIDVYLSHPKDGS